MKILGLFLISTWFATSPVPVGTPDYKDSSSWNIKEQDEARSVCEE